MQPKIWHVCLLCAYAKNYSLQTTAAGGVVKIAKLLIDNGANLNTANGELNLGSPLQFAVFNNKPQMVKYLLECGADPEVRSVHGSTPLHSACFCCGLDIVELLLLHGSNIDAADQNGITPLAYACSTKRVQVVTVLLQAGASMMSYDIRMQPWQPEVVLMMDQERTRRTAMIFSDWIRLASKNQQ